MARSGPNAANPSTKVVHDLDGQPWLVVATPEGYEARRVQITERHLFDRSWQAVRFASEYREIPCCRAVSPEFFVCTLPHEHVGPHEAHGPLPDDEVFATWGGA